MDVDTLLQQGRDIWGDKYMEFDHMVIALGVVYGDLCRQARNQKEGKLLDEQEIKKEMGNLIFSLIRWCDDLGYDPKECIKLAEVAQTTYAAKAKRET